MYMQVMYGACMAFVGWIIFYLFGRQFIYNFKTAFPLIKKMKETDTDLIADTAKKYTVVSCVTTAFIILLCCGLVLLFKAMYIKICFYAGILICLVMVFSIMGPEHRRNFDSFCATYYRFVPDDELRTAMYNKKPSAMKLRLHDMNLSTAFIPEFVKED